MNSSSSVHDPSLPSVFTVGEPHASSKMLLEHLVYLHSEGGLERVQTVLDYGCGSGSTGSTGGSTGSTESTGLTGNVCWGWGRLGILGWV